MPTFSASPLAVLVAVVTPLGVFFSVGTNTILSPPLLSQFGFSSAKPLRQGRCCSARLEGGKTTAGSSSTHKIHSEQRGGLTAAVSGGTPPPPSPSPSRPRFRAPLAS
jgi:hypothetical protein